MTAKERLRELLDARGVWWDYGIAGATTTRFNVNGIDLTFTPMRGELVCSTILTPEQAIAATLGPVSNAEEISDGFHTMAELYHHRAVLFSVIVRNHANLAWKSRAHNDGSMYDGMFIVGIETSAGQATYHYDIDPYWDMFECKELDRAPEWDGHTPDEAIARIATLDDADATRERQDGADERDQLKTENAKLRELCASLYEYAMSEYPDGTELNFADRMRELGAGVDDG